MRIDWEGILDTERENLEDSYEELVAWANGDTSNAIYEEEPMERHTIPRVGKSYAEGTWNGKTVVYKKVWSGHTFTKAEIKKLLAGEEIVLKGIQFSNGTYNVRGKFSRQTYKGYPFVGFDILETSKPEEYPDQYCVGTWRGSEVRFKKTFSQHTFTDEECKKLLNDEVIEFPATTKDGRDYTAKGKLEISEFEGHKCVRFMPKNW